MPDLRKIAKQRHSAFAFSGRVNHQGFHVIAEIPPYGMALIAAFLFALGGQLQNIGLQQVDPRTGTMLTIGSSTTMYWLASPFLLHPEYFLQPAALIFVAIGFVRPAVSANLSVAAIRHIGPTLTSTLNATGPLFGSAFGILILGELLTWQIALGTLGIITSVLILSRRNKKIPTTWPLWALGLPVGAAVIRACSNGFVKIGMNYIPDAYFVGLIGFSVSFLLTTTLHIAKGGGRPKIALNQRGPYWFMLAGAFFGTAALSVNIALLHGSIVTVVPIIAASPVFSMLLSVIIFKREHLNLKIVCAVLIVVASVILIALGK
ncbi:MAG: DMT family transporter [Rhodospirillales bacterium]|nr:DMT family transporter [Rhodospirillales bacterium]